MNTILERIVKGIFLAAVMGGLVYLLTKNEGTAGLIALVMFLSMFARSKEEKVQGAIKHTKEYKQAQANGQVQQVKSERFKNRNKNRSQNK